MTNAKKLPSIAAAALAAAWALTGCGSSSHQTGTGGGGPSQTAVHPIAQPADRVSRSPQLVSASGTSNGTSPSKGATVASEGVGTVTGAPDTLTVGIGVSTTAAHAAAALAQNNTIAVAVQKALENDGVAARDIQTTGLSLQQNWNDNAPDGYSVYDEVTATLHNLARSGTVIDDALAPAGDAGRLDEVNFSMSDSDPLMASARQQAVDSAEAQAEQMASAAGGQLGSLISLSDVSPSSGESPYVGASASASSASENGPPVPIQSGSQQVSVDVYAVWQITAGS